MKRLLATTAIATMAMTGAASAQSLLERVMTQVGNINDNTDVTGIFANTADNVLADDTVPNTVSLNGVTEERNRTVQPGDIILVQSGSTEISALVGEDGTLLNPEAPTNAINFDGDTATVDLGATLLENADGTRTVLPTALSGASFTGVPGLEDGDFSAVTETVTVDGDLFSTTGIDASVTNILRGLDSPTAVTEGGSQATEAVTALIGNIDTTALGAVNDGTIELIGTNQDFEETVDTAIAGTSKAVREVVEHSIGQVGAIQGQTTLAINSAFNETNINASVLNSMEGVNATIGRSGFENTLDGTTIGDIAGMDADALAALTGGVSTTALGAVNTGAIVSGSNDTVDGVVSSIVGNAATNVD